MKYIKNFVDRFARPLFARPIFALPFFVLLFTALTVFVVQNANAHPHENSPEVTLVAFCKGPADMGCHFIEATGTWHSHVTAGGLWPPGKHSWASRVGTFFMSPAAAHSGAVAKDGCHNDKKAGNRHSHIDGNVKSTIDCSVGRGGGAGVKKILAPEIETLQKVPVIVEGLVFAPGQGLLLQKASAVVETADPKCRDLKVEFFTQNNRSSSKAIETVEEAIARGCW